MLKSNIAWMKKNVPSDLKVWKGMIQDIDWSQVAAKTKLSLQRDKDRITAEFKEFAAMDQRQDRLAHERRPSPRLSV